MKGDPYQLGEANRVEDWAEFIIPETATPIAYYDDKHWGKYPAVIENKYGKGTLTYIGTVPSFELLETLLKNEVKKAGISTPGQLLNYPIIVRSGVNDSGKNIHYLFNYSDDSKTFAYPFANGTELLEKKAVAMNDSLQIEAWGVKIIEEK